MAQHAQLTAREIYGPYMQLLTNLQGGNGQEWLDALKLFLRKENPWKKPKLLHFLGTTPVPARATSFIARDHFKVGKEKNNKVKISNIGDSFTNWFLSGQGKVEAVAAAHELARHELVKASLDQQIVEELGGEVAAESTLADIWTKIEAQCSGEDGDLLTKSYSANIFYVRDASGTLRVVFVHWYDGGWRVVASPVSRPREWDAGHRVFASNSVPETV